MKCNRKVAICNENMDTNSLLQFVRARYNHVVMQLPIKKERYWVFYAVF